MLHKARNRPRAVFLQGMKSRLAAITYGIIDGAEPNETIVALPLTLRPCSAATGSMERSNAHLWLSFPKTPTRRHQRPIRTILRAPTWRHDRAIGANLNGRRYGIRRSRRGHRWRWPYWCWRTRCRWLRGRRARLRERNPRAIPACLQAIATFRMSARADANQILGIAAAIGAWRTIRVIPRIAPAMLDEDATVRIGQAHVQTVRRRATPERHGTGFIPIRNALKATWHIAAFDGQHRAQVGHAFLGGVIGPLALGGDARKGASTEER